MQTLRLGFSPCPNDTFIFEAMLHGRVDTEGLTFDVQLEDVETLNQMAFQATLDITKLSYHAYAYCQSDYQLLHAGSALGKGCGPLLIAKNSLSAAEVQNAHIAIPGKYTTANFLLSLAFPAATQKTEYLFSEIEPAVLSGQVDAGLIIHENRFTYQEKGLHKIKDLGAFWETSTGYPIPLGGIVVRRGFSAELQQKINRVLARSVRYAHQHQETVMPYVRQHAQEMDDQVMQQHIGLYVNHYTQDLGEDGRAAIHHLYQSAVTQGLIESVVTPIFID